MVIIVYSGSFRKAFGEALVEAGYLNEDIIVLDADTPKSTWTKLFANTFPHRFINVGISEQDLVSTAAGLAIAGKIPVVAGFSMFLMRGWEQIRNTISRDHLNVKIVGTHSGLSDYMDGASHQCFEDIALMRVLPGFIVLVPGDEIATRKIVLEALLEHKGPVYIRLGRDNAPKIYDEFEEFPIGKLKIIEDPGDIVLFSNGFTLGLALEVANELKRHGISAGVADVYTVKPLDKDGIIKLSKKVNLVVAIEDHSIYGGLGSAIAEVLSESYPKRILRIGIRDEFGVSARSFSQLIEYLGFTPVNIALKIIEVYA